MPVPRAHYARARSAPWALAIGWGESMGLSSSVREVAPRGSMGSRVAVALLGVMVAGVAWAEPRGIDRGPGYATSTWATLHGDSSNSDSVPLVTSTDLEYQWRVLPSAGIVVAPVVAHDGTLFVTTGRGAGTSHLHAISPSGALVWQSAPQETAADLDSGAVLSAPILGDDGGVYVGDSNQFFAFDAVWRGDRNAAEPRWVAELAEHGAEGPFATGILVGERVGGITVHGQVILFERATGELAAPVFELPGGASPEGPVPEFAWQEGLIDPEIREDVFRVLLGYRFEVTNTPAVHPDTERIFLMAGGRTTEEGAFYGIDLVEGAADEDGSGSTRIELAFETKTAPGTGTSPALSPDGLRVYAFGGAGEIFAIDSTTGELLFERLVGGLAASPSVSPDGSIYILAEYGIKKLDGGTGEILWERNYDGFARERMPQVNKWRLFVASGKPVARLDSVITVAPNAVWAVLLGGYELKVAGRELIHAVQSWLVAIDPANGELLASYEIPDTSEGAISVGSQGQIYLDLLSLQASIAAAVPYQRWLPQELRSERPYGGIIAFKPRSRTQHTALALGWAGDVLASGPNFGPNDRLRAVRLQLEAARGLGLGLEIEVGLAGQIREAVEGTLDAISQCEAGNRGPAGCGALALSSRELRLLRSSLQLDTED